MSADQITLDKSRTFVFNDTLNLAFPSERTRVEIKHPEGLSNSRAIFTRATNEPFTDRDGVTYRTLEVPEGFQIELKFEGGKIHVVGPGTVGAKGTQGYFTGAGKASLTSDRKDTEWEGFTVNQGPSYSEGVEKFEIGGSSVEEPDILTVELWDPTVPLNQVFEGKGVNVQSDIDLPQGHLEILTEAGGSTVNVIAQSSNMRSTSGTLKAKGSQFDRWNMHTSSGPQWGPEPMGQGIMYTETGPIFAAAPRVSRSEKNNTLNIFTRGTAYVDVPEGYQGSVTAVWKKWGGCTVDGSQKSGGHYEETDG